MTKEEIREKAYKKWNKKYHIYIDKAIESTDDYIRATPCNGIYLGFVPQRRFMEDECTRFVSDDLNAVLPKSGILSLFTMWVIQGIITWIIKKMLDSYYGK